MSGRRPRLRLRWVGAAACAAGVLLGLASLLKVPGGRGSLGQGRPPFLELATERGADANPALREQLALFDPAPLFLPAGATGLEPGRAGPARARDFGLLSEGFGARLEFPDEQPRLAFERRMVLPDLPAGGLSAGRREDGFSTIGRRGTGGGEQAVARLWLEVAESGTGRIVLEDFAPLPEGWGRRLPAPVEFVGSLDAFGWVGRPMVAVSSGSEETDQDLAKILANAFRIGDRLPPGFYRLRVGS